MIMITHYPYILIIVLYSFFSEFFIACKIVFYDGHEPEV